MGAVHLAALAGCSGEEWPRQGTPLSRSASLYVLPEDVSEVFRDVEKMEIYAVRGSMDLHGLPPPGSDVFHDTLVLGRAPVGDAARRSRILEIVSGGLDQQAPIAACFHPRHGIRAERGGKVVDLVICYQCSAVQLFVDGQRKATIPTRGVRAALDVEFRALGVEPDPDPSH